MSREILVISCVNIGSHFVTPDLSGVMWKTESGGAALEMHGDDGESVRVARSVRLHVQDVTDRTRLERDCTQFQAELAHSQKMSALGELSVGVAHDLQNEFQMIMGAAELLLMRDLSQETRAFAGQIMAATRRSSDMVARLLRIGRKSDPEQRVRLDLHEVVVDSLSAFDHVCRRPPILVRRHLDASHSAIVGNAPQLYSVMLNLMLNARDAMPHGGDLCIRTVSEARDGLAVKDSSKSVLNESYIELSVSDTGIGMSKELQARIFEPFFTTKEPGKGTGMGLALVQSIVRSHGGCIAVYSEPGAGSTFKMRFPLADL